MTPELKRLNDGGAVRSTSGFGRDPLRRPARLRLANNRYSPATVIIDGLSYTVEPRSTRVLRDQSSGPFSYEVTGRWLRLAGADHALYGNETLTVNIY